MSAKCPTGHPADAERTAFGQCMDVLRMSARTPRARVPAQTGAPDPTRPDPTRHRPDEGSGLFNDSPSKQIYSPDPVTSTVAREVWHHLTEGLGWLSLNDHGRSWPLPRRDRLRQLLAEFDDDLCIRAAREAREIVTSQDRAPNITGLFEHRLRELAEVRATVRQAVEFVSGGVCA